MKPVNGTNQEKWRGIVREQGLSALSVNAFCTKHGYALHQFRYWKEKLRHQEPALRFVPAVTAGQTPTDTDLTLEIGKARIVIRPGFDRALLLEAVRALGTDE